MKMIKNIKNSNTWRLFNMERIRPGYQVTINGNTFKGVDQKMATALWVGIASILMVIAFRILLPGVVYAMASFGLHATIGIEAHDMMAGCIFDICRALKDLMIEYTWVGGFLDTIYEYKFIQLVIVGFCGFGFYKASALFYFACVQCKQHFAKEKVANAVHFEARRRRRHAATHNRKVG